MKTSLVGMTLLALCAGAWAQGSSMSLEEASYRAGKARIAVRYQEDLATCKGLGNAQARSACGAAAGVNRDAARQSLKRNSAPTALARYLARVSVDEQQHAAQPASPKPVLPRVVSTTVARAPAALTPVAVAPTPAPHANKEMAANTTLAAPTPLAASNGGNTAEEPPLATSVALVLKANYGGN